MIKNKAVLFFFLFSILYLFSCKKDTDDFGPVVTISSPSENQFFNVNDVIRVKASVSDETKITNLSIRLVDANRNTAHISIGAPVSSPSATINAYYPLDNIHLESGIYYILITASDGKNDSHTYRKIYIEGIPRVVKKVFVASSNSTSQTNFSYIDSAFTSLTSYKNFSGDYIGSSVSGYYQQVYMCGNYTGSFTGIKLSDNTLRFNISPIVSSSPYFTGLYNTDKENYVAQYDGLIRGYGFEGNIIFNANATDTYYTKHMCFNNKYMIAEEKNKTSALRNLITYYPTGAGQQTCSLNQDVVAFCEKDNDEVFVFGNSSGQGVIQLFDRSNNNLWNPYPSSLNPGTILSAVKIDNDTYLIGHSNGTIYKYTYQNPSVTAYLTGYTAIQLKYDLADNQIYIAEANRISILDYPSTTLINSLNSTETVLDIHLLYNR
ncbi:MAG: Ig-like domain-containing protein [Bacteroidota bacterium]